MNGPRRRVLCPAVVALDDRCLLSGLTPAQVTHAYGLDQITFNSSGQSVKADGSGQTIAIVEAYHDPTLAADLHVFDQTFGLPDPSLSQVNLAGSRVDGGWSVEEALDVEWAHAIAPAAAIVVVEAKSSSLPNMMAAVDVARNLPGVSIVSMSWGMTESSNQVAPSRHFNTPAGHIPVTFIASSGDEGPSGGAEWPASVPGVLAVGGTTLIVDDSGTYNGENVWSGSSGGFSRFSNEPAYQRLVQSNGHRSTPDVSFVADPITGVQVYSTTNSSLQSDWSTEGGTSLGAPSWAGILALVNQGRSLAGKGPLDGGSQSLPALYNLSSNDFHKVARGSVTSTGLGTPNGAPLVNDLVNVTPASSAPVVSARGSSGAASRASSASNRGGARPGFHHGVNPHQQGVVHSHLRPLVRMAVASGPSLATRDQVLNELASERIPAIVTLGEQFQCWRRSPVFFGRYFPV